jgi:hypothetical protein
MPRLPIFSNFSTGLPYFMCNQTKDSATGHIERGFAKFNPGAKHIQLSRTECSDISEDTIMGVFIHEVAHAFETATVPDPTNPCYMDAIDYAGDALPSRWCFSKEIAALIIERSQVNHPVTPLSRDFVEENKRWKDYAGALLIAMPVLLASLAIADRKTVYSIISGFAGLVGIIFSVLWYARNGRSFMIRKRYPIFLFGASCFFGIQAAMLAFAILFGDC